MKSVNIVFTDKQKVKLIEEQICEPRSSELVAKTRVTLISTGTECICYRGKVEKESHWAGWIKYPFYPGYSNVSKVVKIGHGVDGVQVGDRIFTTRGHRQYITVNSDASSLVKIPDDISDEEAAWSKLAVIAQTAARRAQVKMGATVAVIGLGPLGQLVTQYLRVVGVEEVLAIDTVQHRLDVAEEHGATQTFCGNAADAIPFIAENTQGQLADIVFDVTGHYSVFPLALKLVRQFGTLLLLGDSPYPSKQHLTVDVVTRQVNVVGSHNEKLPPEDKEWTANKQIELFYKYITRGQMRVADLITHRYRPSDASKVYTKLLDDHSHTVGVLFDWRSLEL